MGRDAFFDLLAANRLLIRRRRRKVITTFSRHRFRKYPNLIKGLVIYRPNQVWVADITYWFTQYGCLYISLVTDAYSKRIMGYAVAPNLHAVNCRNALQMALEQIDREIGKCLIHHCAGSPVRSWDSILQWRVCRLARFLPCADQHDGKGRSLGECGGRAGKCGAARAGSSRTNT